MQVGCDVDRSAHLAAIVLRGPRHGSSTARGRCGGKPKEKTWHPEERILGFLLEVIEESPLNPIAI
jgi:hypothetical protein